MKRVLVTGGAGCIGRHALPLLAERGWDIHATTTGDGPSMPGVTWHRVDLLEPDAARALVADVAPEALLHLAWFIAPGQWAAAPANLDWVTASLDLVRAFSDHGGHRLVVAGSCLEYDWGYGYCSELRTPCAPHTLYGASKNALRLLVEAYAAGTGTSVAWGRIFFLYGPHEHPQRLIASVIRSLLRGEPARCSHGRQVRDYLFAGDVARALVALVERPDVCGPVNIASGEATTLRSLAGRAGDLIGRPDLLQFGAIPAAPTDTPLVVGDVTRLTRELDWRPAYTLDAGLNLTIDWWREQLEREMSVTR